MPGSPFRPLYDDKILFSGQPVALVVAETLEPARDARLAGRGRLRARAAQHRLRSARWPRSSSRRRSATASSTPKSRGDAKTAFDGAPSGIAGEYHLAGRAPQPDGDARDARWSGTATARITVYDKTQGSQNVQQLPRRRLRLRQEGRARAQPVRRRRLRLGPAAAVPGLPRGARRQDARALGARGADAPADVQPRASARGAADGRARRRRATAGCRRSSTTRRSATSRFEDYMEMIVNWGLMAYACDNASGDYKLAPARHLHAGRHARARRGHRHDAVRDRDGRAGLRGRRRSARAAAHRTTPTRTR